jgi:hypothetical protein
MVMLQQTLEFLFPVMVVVTFLRSFVATLVFSMPLPKWLHGMLGCPLCLGFHVSWMWLLVCFGTGRGVIFAACYILTSSFLCYVVEHATQCLQNANMWIQLQVSTHEERVKS